MALIDEISPTYIGEDRFALTLADHASTVLAFVPFQVDVNYGAALPAGIVLPIELLFQAPDGKVIRRTVFTRTPPSSLLLVPRQRGQHSVLLREMFHNRWQGRLFVDVQGDDLNDGKTRVL